MISRIRTHSRMAARIVMGLVWAVMFAPAAQAIAAQAVIPGFNTGFGQTPAVTALPVLQGITQGAAVDKAVKNRLTVRQTQAKAILEWESFNIGADAAVVFDQQGNTSWAALNRIYDASPSRIFGSLKADGQVYLINANGILFGAGSRVDVHSLAASSLDITDNNFINGRLVFSGDEGRGGILNQGTIQAGYQGNVLLLGPDVANGGTILAPSGAVILAAGTSGTWLSDEYGRVYSQDFVPGGARQDGSGGLAYNLSGGSIITDSGNAALYGRIVNQEGLVRSVSALKKSGRIELKASELIHTGPSSRTICPVSASTETADQSFAPVGTISLGGLDSTGDSGLRIWHQGVIAVPSGTVELTAGKRVLLDSGSIIDVSGLWVDKPAAANLIEAQLNSVELRDDDGQKDGILKGETVSYNATAGTAIGDTSGSLATTDVTARDQSTEGGTIRVTLSDAAGEFIAKQGSTIAFAGGGYRFGSGSLATTKLVSGNRIYDIGSAPEYITYDTILDSQTRIDNRYGVSRTYQGIYYGGVNSLHDYVGGFIQGSDAGGLTLKAAHIALDGGLYGAATAGIYQTKSSDPTNASGQTKVRGRVEPLGGSLILGNAEKAVSNDTVQYVDRLLDDVVIGSDYIRLAGTFGLDDALPQERLGITYIDPQTVSLAGLSALTIGSNTAVSVAEDARLVMPAGASLDILAGKKIDIQGDVRIPSGSIALYLSESYLNDPNTGDASSSPADQGILVSGKLDVAGREVDNREAGWAEQTAQAENHLTGGTITLQDETRYGQGVAIESTASVDVSGGYVVSSQGAVTAGDAGTLSIQGSSVRLSGDIRGYAVTADNEGGAPANGGTFELRGLTLTVRDGDEGTLEQEGGMVVLQDDRLKDTGFTQINLMSVYGLTLDEGVKLRPSNVKRAVPVTGSQAVSSLASSYIDTDKSASAGLAPGLVTVAPEMLGVSSLTLSTGKGKNYTSITLAPVADNTTVLAIPEGTSLRVGPKGTVNLGAPGIEVAGEILAPSGTITANASEAAGLKVQDGAMLSVAGYLKPGASAAAGNLPVEYIPVDAGIIDLTAGRGALTIESGAVLDISGSPLTGATNIKRDGSITTREIASAPGTLNLTYYADLDMQGDILAQAHGSGLKGATLGLTRSNTAAGVMVVSGAYIDRWLDLGFDALRLTSGTEINFSDNIERGIGRSLILDAPVISAQDGLDIALAASSIMLTNSAYPTSAETQAGSAGLNLNADWIEVQGAVNLAGFNEARLSAAHDIALADEFYTARTTAETTQYAGHLKTPANLTLAADRIYPTTLSDFTIEAGQTLTTLPGRGITDGAILSAGGQLTLKATTIRHGGAVYAPMGTIALDSTARTYVADGGTLSTQGQGRVSYGTLGETAWTITDKSDLSNTEGIAVSAAPESSITITSDSETIVSKASTIDASGGGSVFAARYVSGTDGTYDPLDVDGQYVIVPGTSLAGDSVVLKSGAGIAAGTYTLVSTREHPEYAFLPGAIILVDKGLNTAGGNVSRSSEGYAQVSGYVVSAGLSKAAPLQHVYAVRDVDDVLRGFDMQEITAGDAGNISISAPTALISGRVTSAALRGYAGGILALSASTVNVLASSSAMVEENGAADIGPEDVIPEELKNSCTVSAEGLSGSKIGLIAIGDEVKTKSVTIQEDALLSAPRVRLAAREAITLKSGGRIEAVDEDGGVTLAATSGTIVLEEGAQVHAGDSLTLDALAIDNRGSFLVDHSTLNLASDRIVISAQGYADTQPQSGLKLTLSGKGGFEGFEGFDHIGLAGRSEVVFQGAGNLEVEQAIIIDTPKLAYAGGASEATVDISAAALTIRNSTGTTATDDSLSDTAHLSLEARNITMGRGAVLADGFGNITLKCAQDLTMTGEGAFTADGGSGNSMNISAGRITTAAARVMDTGYTSDQGLYETARFTLDAGARAMQITSSGAEPGDVALSQGGSLTVTAASITNGGLICMPAGTLRMSATQGDIILTDTARIENQGTDLAPGGGVILDAQGDIVARSGAGIDVSAGEQGNAGSIQATALSGMVDLGQASLIGGSGTGGDGAELAVLGRTVSGLGALARAAYEGGITGVFSVQAEEGDLTLEEDGLIKSQGVDLSTGSGSLNVAGTIDAGGTTGGSVALEAGKDLTLSGSITAAASGDGEEGGVVRLAAGSNDTTGMLSLSGAVNVAGGSGGPGGEVYLRAPRASDNLGVNMTLSGGTVAHAGRIVAEAFKTYSMDTITAASIATTSTIYTDTRAFADNASTLSATLFGAGGLNVGGGDIHVLAGIEIASDADLTLGTDWDLTSSWHFGSKPVMLTLKAGNDLILNGNLVDHPTAAYLLKPDQGMNSAGVTLKAGRDIRLTGYKLVYTENGPLDFRAGRDVRVSDGVSPGYMVNDAMSYSLGTYDGRIRGTVGRDLILAWRDEGQTLHAGAVQSATGDIILNLGRDLVMGSDTVLASAVRTTGFSPGDVESWWLYQDGGDIRVDAAGGITGGRLATQSWDNMYEDVNGELGDILWAADYSENPTLGLAAMGGGDLSIRAGGDFYSQAGTFGQQNDGDLTIIAGGDINGRFLTRRGACELTALGNFGVDLSTLYPTENQIIEAFDTGITVTAMGDIVLGTVLNPTYAYPGLLSTSKQLSYTDQTALSLTAATGDITLTGTAGPYAGGGEYKPEYGAILPARVSLTAGRDINVMHNFTIAPSGSGSLNLSAGRDINGSYSDHGSAAIAALVMSDVAPGKVYGKKGLDPSVIANASQDLIHLGDGEYEAEKDPLTITAGRDIHDVKLLMPKSARIVAGNDIHDIYVSGQNLPYDGSTDMSSLIMAGNDIVLSTINLSNTYQTGIIWGGPGTLVVQAGNNLDLGNTSGIQTMGNLGLASGLGSQGTDLIVAAGITSELDQASVDMFFKTLKDAGEAYSTELADDPQAAATIIADVNANVIEPFLGEGADSQGQINMTRSQIKTFGKDSDINIIARAAINVGRSDLPSSSGSSTQTGIVTDAGGAINTFAVGDVNVLESRMMTMYGGDIVVWSQAGNINAGRGSKTAVNRGASKIVIDEVDEYGNIIKQHIETPAVAVGSGIRTVTYDPDGAGPQDAPGAGDAYIFAPVGYIDAGEAGIGAENLYLGAEEVRNTQNIEVGGMSVGVPVASVNTAAIGALSGSSALAGAGAVSESMSAISSTGAAKQAAADEQSYVPKWIKVMVLGFDEDEATGSDKAKDKDKKESK